MTYFKHMSNMRHDTRIRRVIARYGIEGYGLYCLIIESIVEKLSSISPQPSLEDTCEDVASFYHGNTAKINEIMNFMINQGLFEIDEVTNLVTCNKIYKYLEQSATNSKALRALIASRKEQNVMTNGDGVMTAGDDVSDFMNRLDKTRLDKTINYVNAESAKADPATNETLPALSSPTKSLKAKKEPKYGPVAHAVKEVIWNGTIKASGLVLTPQQSGAQAKALWEVVNRIVLQFGEDDAVDAAHSIIGTYNRLRQSDRFMAKQPLTPLALAGQGIWGQVLEAMREQRLTPEMQDFVAEVLKAQGGRA